MAQWSEEFEQHLREGCRRAEAIAERIDAGHLASELPRVRAAWVEIELPSRCPKAWARIWDAVRSAPDPARVMRWRERRRYRSLPATVTVHRGASPGGERGWSWTLDRTVAEDFAVRYSLDDDEPADARLCTARVPRTDVLALFLHGGELEIVLDPRRLGWRGVEVEQLSRRA